MASRKRASNHDGPGDETRAQTKKTKVNAGNDTTSKTDANGDVYWEISKMRRVTVSEFRGKTMVSVREYYEKEGQELPGKKGISMSLDQFSALIKILPEIEQAIVKQGGSLPRPEYSGAGARADDDDHHEQNAPGDESPSKKNIEATSDEESDS